MLGVRRLGMLLAGHKASKNSGNISRLREFNNSFTSEERNLGGSGYSV